MTLLVNGLKTEHDRKLSFLKFINERENIRRKKEAGDRRPWTKDEILQQYHFCNMIRADDRVTKWIGAWSEKWAPRDRWFSFAVARWINEPDTMAQLPTVWSPMRYKNILRHMAEKNLKIFRAAYIITGVVAGPGQKKYVAVVDSVLDPLYRAHLAPPNSCELSWKLLRQYPGQGSFMAGQIVADWNTFGIIKGNDTKTWAPLGPGSIKGLNIIFRGDADAKKMNQQTGVVWMRELADLIDDKLPNLGKRATLHDVQNMLCEFSKYVRGYSKTQYVPHKEKLL
jgi:5-hmdU DNA kinase-like protein